jgi:hypothetical protein
MISKHLVASGAIAISLIGYPLVLHADEMLNVENWPNDVPCNVLKKHTDGITAAWSRFFQQHLPGTKYRNTRETDYWDRKCKGQTL